MSCYRVSKKQGHQNILEMMDANLFALYITQLDVLKAYENLLNQVVQ